MKKTYTVLISIAVALSLLIQVPTILMWVLKGKYVPYIIGLPIRLLAAVIIIAYYYIRTAYICPACNTKFKSKILEFTFARHTLKTRRLKCTNCGTKDYCLEVFSGEN